MPKVEPNNTTRTIAVVIAILVVAIALVAGGLLLHEYGPGNMGIGFLQGGLVGLAAFAVVLWRVSRRPGKATMFERAFTQTGDEREDAVLTRAFGVLGACALPLTGVAAVAIALGALTEMVLALLMIAQALVGVIAFVVISRRS